MHRSAWRCFAAPAIRRLQHAGIPRGDDLVRQTYGSEDFRNGVRAFVEKREAQWTGC